MTVDYDPTRGTFYTTLCSVVQKLSNFGMVDFYLFQNRKIDNFGPCVTDHIWTRLGGAAQAQGRPGPGRRGASEPGSNMVDFRMVQK